MHKQKLGQHEHGPEHVGDSGGGRFVAQHFQGGSKFGLRRCADQGVGVDPRDQVTAGGPVTLHELLGPFRQSSRQKGTVGEVDRFQRGEFVGAHGDDLIAVGPTQ